ncbi:GAF and ANTAR domain-containing protein [Trebonia sp.]|uniref:GAF and ANTAR domain-containing protein n=1 Tax=Trebonia sp. TaxID=2767075 RepID=UPI00262344F4|nr:GAF and ANTAR domain-containing protein [Trebonia sp.]
MAGTDRRVREAFIELTDTLVTDFDVIDFLARLAVRCTELLGVSACGVMLADHHGVLNLVAASTEQARLLELSQLQNPEGPSLEAYLGGRAVQCTELASAGPRWPRFAAAAIAAGFTGVYALPMRLRDQRLGALNVFCAEHASLDADTAALGQALADAATIGIVHQRAMARSEVIAEQLQTALNSRILIEQAKGFLAERLHVTVEDAFAVLRGYARDHNRKLTDVAADVTAGRLDPAESSAPSQALSPDPPGPPPGAASGPPPDALPDAPRTQPLPPRSDRPSAEPLDRL